MEELMKKLDKKLKITSYEYIEEIVQDSKGMSARAAKTTVNNGLAKISDDTILRLLKKNDKHNR